MAEPRVVLSEDEYPCPVLPPARAAGSVRNNYFAQELPEAHDAGSPCSLGQAEIDKVADLPQSSMPVTVLLLLTLPLALPLIVYLGVNNPFIYARSDLLVGGFLDLDDDVAPIVRNTAHKGRYLRTVDGGFEEELSRMAAASPALAPQWSLPRTDSLMPPLHRVIQGPPHTEWPWGRKSTGGFANATPGSQHPDDADALMRGMLPFKKMRREDRTTTNFAIPAGGAATFNGLPELLEFTRVSPGANVAAATPRASPSWGSPDGSLR